MKLLLKDQVQKLKKNWVQFISLSLLVIIISLTFTAVKSSIERLETNYEPFLEEYNVEDFYFSIDEIDVNYLSGTAFTELCSAMHILPECGIAVSLDTPESMNDLNVLINQKIKESPHLYEQFVDGYLHYFEDEYGFEIEKQLVIDIKEDGHSFKFLSIHEDINLPYLLDGRLPISSNEIMIFKEYAELNDLELLDELTIDGRAYTIVGYAYSPEFLFPILNFSTIQFDAQTQTLVFAKEQTIRMTGHNLFYRYAVKGDLSQIAEIDSYSTVQNIDRSSLGRHMQMVSVLLPSDLNYRIITLKLEVENASVFIDLFITTFMIVLSLLILLFIKRYIDKYKKDIDILSSMGYTKKEITLSYMLFPFLLSTTSIIGYVIGLLLSSRLFNLYSSRYFFPKAEFDFSLKVALIAILVPIIVISVVSYIFIYITIDKKKKTIKRIKLKIFKYIPLKTVTQLSIIFILINSILLFGLNGNNMFSEFVDVTSLGNNYEEMVVLRYFDNSVVDEDYETFTRIYGSINSINNNELDNYRTTIYGINDSVTMKALIDNDIQQNSLLDEGAIISEYLAELTNAEIGDTITFTVGADEITYVIKGISNELIESNIFIRQNELNELYGLDEDMYNGIYTDDDAYSSSIIQMRLNYNKSVLEVTSILNISSIIISIISVLSIILGLYIFGLLMILYLTENKHNIAILQSLGYTNKEVNIKYTSGVAVILFVTYLVSIPITWLFLDLMLKSIMNIVGFKLILTLKPVNIVIGLLFLVILFGLSIVFISRYNKQISIPEALKEQ